MVNTHAIGMVISEGWEVLDYLQTARHMRQMKACNVYA